MKILIVSLASVADAISKQRLRLAELLTFASDLRPPCHTTVLGESESDFRPQLFKSCFRFSSLTRTYPKTVILIPQAREKP